MVPEEGWVGAEDVAAPLRVAKESTYRWIDSKSFPAHRVDPHLRFKLSEVDERVTASGGDDSASAPSGRTTEARQAGRKTNVKKSRHG